jgi:hypothetical protein
LKLADETVVQFDGQIRRQTQRARLVTIQREFIVVANLQQVGTLIFNTLSELVHLHQIDHTDILEGGQPRQSPLLKAEVILGVADLLELLQQADIPADAALTGKARDDGITTAALRSGHPQFANHDLRIETLAVLMVGPHVRQQGALDQCQLLQRDIAPGPAQQRLDE